MTDTLISFETAKLAKEKGFDLDTCQIEVFACDTNGKYSEQSIQLGFPDSTFIQRPTQSLLQKWLREVHGIHVTVIHRNYFSDNKEYYDYLLETTEVMYRKFTTYEEALEEGLVAGLNLIKS